jgi:hypothetical protein
MNLFQTTCRFIKQTGNRYLFILLISCFVIGLSGIGCGKLVDNCNADFVGTWESDDGVFIYRLIIDKKSQAEYYRCDGQVFNSQYYGCEIIKGKARIKDDNLIIKLKKFDIELYPTRNSGGVYICRLNSILFTKR